MSKARENHKAVRNERFHRYLNHVERLNTANTGHLNSWVQGVLFAMYAWNASPVDGTNIIRSVASIGREFPFPLDLQPPVPGERASLEGQQTLDHFDAMAPLIAYQRELFQILVKERRSRHRELRNASIKARRFNVGDLVMVRKQVKSDAKKGISAKLLLRPKGVYRVIAEANPGSSYWLQRLPFCQGLGVPGKIVKQKSSRMERLPSVVVLSRMAEGADSRFAHMNGPLAESPLAKWLKVIDYGTYRKAPGNANFAYDAADDLWPQPDDDDDDDDEDDDERPFGRYFSGPGTGGRRIRPGQTRADIRQLTTKQPTVRNNAFADHHVIPPFHLDDS